MKKRFLLFIAGIVLTLLVVNLFGLAEVTAAVAAANPLYIAAALLLQFVGMVLLAARMRLIGGPYLQFSKAFRVAMSGSFVSLITPVAKIGGEPLKIYMLKNSYGSSKATAVIAVDDFIEIFANLLVILVAVLFFAPSIAPGLTTIFVIFLIIVILILGGIMKLLLTPRWLKHLVDWFLNKISKYQNVEKKDYAKMFYNAFTILLRRKGMLVSALVITIVIKVIEFAIIWLAFTSIGAALPWREVVLLWSIIVVFLFVPWLPGSLGLVEFGATSALIVLGLQSSIAASGILINRFVSFWFVLLVGLIALYQAKTKAELPKGLRLKDVDEKSFKIEKGSIGKGGRSIEKDKSK
jgi:hypothetical protein